MKKYSFSVTRATCQGVARRAKTEAGGEKNLKTIILALKTLL
jgi:hypothetical protein